MKRYTIGVVALAVAVAASCTKETDVKAPEAGKQIEFHAVWADDPGTRTVLQSDGTSVWWTPGEEINAFYGNKFSGKFTSTNTSNKELVSFQGTLTVLTGTAETGNEASAYWAVYPYNADNTCDGQSVTLTIPDVQTAKEGTFADKFFPSVATSQSLDLAFYNVCGGVRFSVSQSGIQSITFKSNNGEALVGKVKVGFGTDGVPVVKSMISGKSEVTVTAPSGGFVPGKYYFAAFLPGILSQGLAMTFYTSSHYAAYTSENSITVNRSRFGKLDEKDKDLTFVAFPFPVPEAVDLGLPSGLKWASFNLGASEPEEYGDYYAWGETEPKSAYSWATYKWWIGYSTSLTKYNTKSSYGTVDNKTVLDPEDDAAHVNLGGKWRMPTDTEWTELRENCTWEWTTLNGVKGSKVISKKSGYTDKWIFFPAAGYRYDASLIFAGTMGDYWSSSLYTDNPIEAWYVYFQSDVRRDFYNRDYGRSVRPVYSE